MDYSKLKARIRKKKFSRVFLENEEQPQQQQKKPTEAKICVMCRCHTECTNCKDEQASPLSSISNIYLSSATITPTTTTSLSSCASEASLSSSIAEETKSNSSSSFDSNSNNFKKYSNSNLSEVKSLRNVMFRTSLVTNSGDDDSGKSRQNHLLTQRILSLFVIFISMNLLTTLFISTITITGVDAATGSNTREVRLKKQEGIGELIFFSSNFIGFLSYSSKVYGALKRFVETLRLCCDSLIHRCIILLAYNVQQN